MEGKPDTDDLALLARVVGGEREALGELFVRHGARCLRRAHSVLRDAALAEDAVQEAFLDLWRTADRFDAQRAPLAAWLCVLVHRRAVDVARREARRRALEGSLLAFPEDSNTTEEELLLILERRRVRRAVDGLSEQQRQVVELAYYGGLTQSELAHRLGVPLGTVKSRTAAALAALALAVAA